MIKGFEEITDTLCNDEKKLVNAIFRVFYGKMDLRRKAGNLSRQALYEIGDLSEIKFPKGARIRKIVYFIRNKIILENANKILAEDNLEELPESYKKIFWVVANSKGYMATQNKDKIKKHIESLEQRVDRINDTIESGKLLLKALYKLEEAEM